MPITFVAENDFAQIKEANKHLLPDEGMIFVKCVLFKRSTTSEQTLGQAPGVFMIGPRAELRAELLRLFDETFKNYDEVMKNDK